MFDLFRSRDKAVRILLGGLLLLVAFSMLTYLVPNYSNGSSGSDTVIAEIGKDTITLAEAQRLIQATDPRPPVAGGHSADLHPADGGPDGDRAGHGVWRPSASGCR